MTKSNHFSRIVSVFQEMVLPETRMTLVGYAAIIAYYDLQVPSPQVLAAISEKYKVYQTSGWQVFSPKYLPEDTLAAHLTFALKYEPVDLAILRALFLKISPSEIEAIIQNEPTGQYSRRLWFFYEWLTGKKLALPNATKGNYVDALLQNIQYCGYCRPSKRHRVNNNLPGVPDFCPLIRRTVKLDQWMKKNLPEVGQKLFQKVPQNLLSRSIAFLALRDSKASYNIEDEKPTENRAMRWARALQDAGEAPLSEALLMELQKEVLADNRFVKLGWRLEGGFIGVHDPRDYTPTPDHISARWQDIPELISGLIQTNSVLKESDFNPILAAAIIAFGFVFIHPFEDGNGRIHRWLIQYVAKNYFFQSRILLPISATILKKLDYYREVLESFSNPRLSLIEWESTPKGNVEVLNETIDLYRYFDATSQAEFLFECLEEILTKTLPQELQYLQQYDQMMHWIKSHFEMPDPKANLLIAFLNQGNGKLSKRALSNEFVSLTSQEVQQIESAYQKTLKVQVL